jgi:hypothetical protein
VSSLGRGRQPSPHFFQPGAALKGWLRCGVVAIAVASLAIGDGLAATINVNVTNESGNEDGTPAHPYNTIQEGIDHAVQGDRVQVAPGVYKETVLMKDGVDLLGSGAQTTFIDGNGLQNSVVTFNGTRLSPLLRGFTIRNGHGDQISMSGGVPVYAGGGILILDSSPFITKNVITQNTITQGYCLGGGIYIRSNSAAPQIIDNVISGNVARSSTQPGSGEGGAIYIVTKTGSCVVKGNRIESNQAVNGGGIHIENETVSTVQVSGNLLRNNDATNGGAILSRVIGGSVSTIVNNVIVGNGSALTGAHGGGIAAYALGTGGFSIANNTLAGNVVAAGNGGALWLDDSVSSADNVVANNIFSGNTALHGGGIDDTAYFGDIRYNDFFGNTGGDIFNGGGGGATLIANLFSDPGFVAPTQGNYQLTSGSPCIDAADATASPADDFSGFPRPFDGDVNVGAVSDIGAHEYPAGEASGLTFLADGLSLNWQTFPMQDGYNVYRGSLARLRSTGEYTQNPSVEPLAAHWCNVLPTQMPLADPFEPTPGVSVFYLVTVVIDNWEGPLGANAFGLHVPNDNPCP